MRGRKGELMGLAAAALLAVGCAHGNSATADAANADAGAVVHVSNNNWSDMNVYVVRGTMRQRLGTVSSLATGKFRLPRHIFTSPEPMRLLADPIGGAQQYLSPPLLVNPGQVVEWRLENNVQLSSAFIR
jgi:hypothetical protein